ncbi:hypothetical protein B0H13DRAFT_2394159 [Mycena leptocephala]|nr:hypothetical protein B0H13DRAFT_2394159 [Mycena leptocephala]
MSTEQDCCPGRREAQMALLPHRPCFHRSYLDLYLDIAVRVRPCPCLDADAEALAAAPHTSGLTGQMLKEAPPPPVPYFMHPHFILCAEVRRTGSVSADLAVQQCYPAALQRACCTQFELIVRLRLDRASYDASICACHSPPLIQRRPPMHAVFWCRREQSLPPHSFADLD